MKLEELPPDLERMSDPETGEYFILAIVDIYKFI